MRYERRNLKNSENAVPNSYVWQKLAVSGFSLIIPNSDENIPFGKVTKPFRFVGHRAIRNTNIGR